MRQMIELYRSSRIKLVKTPSRKAPLNGFNHPEEPRNMLSENSLDRALVNGKYSKGVGKWLLRETRVLLNINNVMGE
jgi:hypothetical protein